MNKVKHYFLLCHLQIKSAHLILLPHLNPLPQGRGNPQGGWRWNGSNPIVVTVSRQFALLASFAASSVCRIRIRSSLRILNLRRIKYLLPEKCRIFQTRPILCNFKRNHISYDSFCLFCRGIPAIYELRPLLPQGKIYINIRWITVLKSFGIPFARFLNVIYSFEADKNGKFVGRWQGASRSFFSFPLDCWQK